MKQNHTTTNGIRIALFATFLLLASLNLSAQYKLELEWQKTPSGQDFSARGLAITSDDSLLIVSGDYSSGQVGKFLKIKTSSGEVVGVKDNVKAFNYIKIMKDGKNMLCSSESNGTFGIYDIETFEERFSIGFPVTLIGFSFSESQNKAVICGKSLIRVYDVVTKEMVKEFNSEYFKSSDVYLQDAKITDDGKYIVYGYLVSIKQANGNYTTKYYLEIIDIDGNVIKTIDESSSAKFTFTVDGKTLIYFMPDAMHFLDVTSMQEKEGIPIGGANPEGFEMSRDGKVMLLGYGGGLVYYDLETKKSFYLSEGGTWRTFRLNANNSSLYYGLSRNLYKLNIKPTTSIKDEQNKHEFTIQVNNNDLLLTSKSGLNPNLTFKIISIDSRIATNVLPNETQLISNGMNFDISNLQSGAYFLQIFENQNVISVLNFLKVN